MGSARLSHNPRDRIWVRQMAAVMISKNPIGDRMFFTYLVAEVDTGMLADIESSPMYRGSKAKFERSLSKFATFPEGGGEGGMRMEAGGEVGLAVEGGPPPPRGPRQYQNPFRFGSEDAKKKAERAKRFNDTKYKFETETCSATVVEAQEAMAAVIGDEELLSLYKR